MPAAYALDVTAQEIIFVVGPLVTVAAVMVAGPAGGLYAAAALQAAGTIVFLTAPAAIRWRGRPVASRHWAGSLRAPMVRLLALATLLIGAGLGATVIAVGSMAPGWSGWLLSAQAAGALAGGVVATRFPVTAVWRRLPWLVGLFALSYAPLALAGSVAAQPSLLLVPAMLVSGMGLPAVLSHIFTATDEVSPAGTATESFAWIATAFGVGSALGSAANGSWFAAGFLLAPGAIASAALLMRFVYRLPAGIHRVHQRDPGDAGSWTT